MFNRWPGYNIIVDHNLTKLSGWKVPRYIDRSWKERLFTRPWRPWRKDRLIMVPEIIPDPRVYKIGNSWVMHPATKQALVEAIDEDKAP